MICLMPIISLIAWVVIPFLYMQGNALAGDDVTKFLYDFTHDYHPLIVSVVAVVIIAAGVIVIMKKEIIKTFVLEIRK